MINDPSEHLVSTATTKYAYTIHWGDKLWSELTRLRDDYKEMTAALIEMQEDNYWALKRQIFILFFVQVGLMFGIVWMALHVYGVI